MKRCVPRLLHTARAARLLHTARVWACLSRGARYGTLGPCVRTALFWGGAARPPSTKPPPEPRKTMPSLFSFIRNPRFLLENLPVYDVGECPYLPGRREHLRAVRMSGASILFHSFCAELGFRRSGDMFYRPACDGCNECVPMRIEARNFRPGKKQRHIANKNHDIETTVEYHVELTDEKYELYRRYMEWRHTEPEDDESHDRRGAAESLFSPLAPTVEIQYRLDGRLVGLTIADLVPHCLLSSVYHFYEPELARRSIGTFSVLAEIDLCRKMAIPYYYLGYWVRGCRKMEYKANYRPYQLRIDGEWVTPHPL